MAYQAHHDLRLYGSRMAGFIAPLAAGFVFPSTCSCWPLRWRCDVVAQRRACYFGDCVSGVLQGWAFHVRILLSPVVSPACAHMAWFVSWLLCSRHSTRRTRRSLLPREALRCRRSTLQIVTARGFKLSRSCRVGCMGALIKHWLR